MDFEILPQLIIIISVAGVLIIIGKNFSKIKELEQQEEIFLKDVEEQELKEKFVYLYNRAIRRFINKENYHQKVTAFWVWTEKALRKARIALLKVDSRFVAMLQNLRKKNVEAVEKIKEAEEIAQENTEETLEEKRVVGLDRSSLLVESEVSKTDHLEQKSVVENTEVENLEQESFHNEQFSNEEPVVPEEKYHENIAEAHEDSEDKSVEKVEEKREEDHEEQEENIETRKVRTKKEQEYIDMLLKDPRDIKSYWKLGVLYSKRKNYEDSLACFRQIIKIDPTYTKAKQKAIELMEKMRGHGGNEK